ncbi:MAG: major facilitator transporter [Puniceicoccaceae bacterium 5H]|nr:MAG: major facilitator transporter [Puniceicoccaceae bacterium 5H]
MKASQQLVPAGVMLVGVTYGLARYAYGLFLPQMRDDVGMDPTVAGFVASAAYAGYCVTLVLSALLTHRVGPRAMAIAAGAVATLGLGGMALSHQPLWLATGVLVAGMSTGLSSSPMAAAVSRRVSMPRQARANTLINSGTSLGVAVAGPLALLAASEWRAAYASFAGLAAFSTVWAAVVVPGREPDEADGAQHAAGERRSLWRREALPIALAATGMGFAASIYWTFAGEVVTSLGGFSEGFVNQIWLVIGLAGLLGGAAGDLVRRFGIGWVNAGSLFVLAASLVTLVVGMGNLALVLASAAAFGASFIMLTGVYLVWGVDIYADRPAMGPGVPFLMIAVGQFIGAAFGGWMIGLIGFGWSFGLYAVAALACALVWPKNSPEE